MKPSTQKVLDMLRAGDGIAVPFYDTDWSATGPLIEKHEISIDCCPWVAYTAHHDASGATPLLAVCHLILALKEAGKL